MRAGALAAQLPCGYMSLMSPSDGIDESPPARRPPTRRFEVRRSAIVDSAVEEMNRKGVRGMTLSDVAARLQLVPTGVIYYFKNKEELAEACFLRSVERYHELIAAGEAQPAGPGRVEAFLRAYFDFKEKVALGQTADLAKFNDVRALNNSRVNAAYTDMFRHARVLLASPGEPLDRPGLNARTHLLLSEVFWIVAWIHQAEVGDYDRSASRMSAILTQGFIDQGVAYPQAHQIDLAIGEGADPEDSPELFLRAATQLINEEGYHGASVERISARLNVSKGAFYHHNATKDELVVACFHRAFDIMWRAIRAAEDVGGSSLQILVTIAVALVRFQMAGSAPLLRTSAFTTLPEGLQPELMAKFDRISYRFASIISDGIADGSIRPIDVNVGAQMITTMINAAVELPFWAPTLTADSAVDHYVRPFFEGLFSRRS